MPVHILPKYITLMQVLEVGTNGQETASLNNSKKHSIAVAHNTVQTAQDKPTHKMHTPKGHPTRTTAMMTFSEQRQLPCCCSSISKVQSKMPMDTLKSNSTQDV